MITIKNYEFEGNHYYVVPGRVMLGFTEDPFYLEACDDPNLLAQLVQSAREESIISDENIRTNKVPLELWERVEAAISRKDHLAFLMALRCVENYNN